MGIRPVLFEDHTLMHFRPLAWSVPVPEIRCGLFSARERVDLVQPGGGLLAVRPELASLVRAPGWQALPAAPASGQTLWLSGRLAPDCRQVSALLAAAAAGEFALTDTSGLLAMAAGAGGSVVAESWTRWAAGNLAAPQAGTALPAWSPPLPATWDRIDVGSGLVWHRPQEGGAPPPAELAPSLAWIWNIVPRTPAAIQADIAAVRDGEWRRWPFGLDPDPAGPEPVWCRPSRLQTAPAGLRSALVVRGENDLLVGADVEITPGAVIDTSHGPVILDREVAVGAHVFLEGPLYVGPGSRIKAGATLYGESAFGIGNRLAGEIGESTFGDFSNKQHDGFIGHAVLGSWVNLGAATTCSDLKNNYGPVRVDLGWGGLDTGLRFVGLLMGDHAKTAIGTLFNTGTCVGFAANVFGAGMPPKHVRNLSWGGRADSPAYAVDKAVATAEVVLQRRSCLLGPAHEALFRLLASS